MGIGKYFPVHKLIYNRCCLGDRNGISYTLNRRSGNLGRIDTDNLSPHIQQRSSTITGIDRSICLNDFHLAALCASILTLLRNLPVLGTDIAHCHRLAISQSITNSNYHLADLALGGISQSGDADGI